MKKGISGGPSAWRTLHCLTANKQDAWMAEMLLRERMWVDPSDYGALHACVKNDAVEVAKLLLEHGMDFEQYRQWAENRPCGDHAETLQALAEHWQSLQEEPRQSGGPEPIGPVLG